MVKSGVQVTPSYSASLRRLQEIEHRYMVSLKLWISCNEEANGPGYFKVHISGSGYIFDHVHAAELRTEARIISAFDDPFGSALWHCLDHLEAALSRHEGHLIGLLSH